MNNKYIISITLLIFASSAYSQESNPHIVPQYDFIKYDLNQVDFYGDSSDFESFYTKLDTLIFQGKGKINVMQVGGSHIQADIWSNQLRQSFQKLSPGLNGGRGFLFPYRLAHTNNPGSYKVSYTGNWKGFRNSVNRHHAKWGVCGITATTYDSISSFKMKFNKGYTNYDFNRIKIFHDLDSSSFTLQFTADSCITTTINNEIGYTEFTSQNRLDSLEITITKTDSNQNHFSLYGISLENDDPGIVYHSIGVNGASTESYLRCEMFPQHLPVIKPDLVIFSVGINDAYYPDFKSAKYESNYDTIINWIKTVSPNAAILFTTNNDSYFKRRYPNKRAEEVRNAMIRLAKKHGAGIWDMYGVMGGLGSVRTWELNGLAKRDKVHFTKKGYLVVGDLLFSALIKKYDNHLTK